MSGPPVPKYKHGSHTYTCIVCGREMDANSLMASITVHIGKNRQSKILACVEHFLGAEVFQSPMLSGYFNSKQFNEKMDSARNNPHREMIRASRFKVAQSPESLPTNGFQEETEVSPGAVVKSSQSFIPTAMLPDNLGISREAIVPLVEALKVKIVTFGGAKCVTKEDFDAMCAEIRKRTIASKRERENASVENEDDLFAEDDIEQK